MPPKVKFTTTLRKIKSFSPCFEGWEQLTSALGTTDSDAEVSLAFILNSNGIRDAIWALRCFDYKDYCLFIAAVAESVVHLNPDPRVSAAIAAVRAWHSGKISEEELRDAAYAAADAARAAYAAADAARAAYAAADAARAAEAAAYAAAAEAAAYAAAAEAAARAADAAVRAAAYAAAYAAVRAVRAAAEAAAYAAAEAAARAAEAAAYAAEAAAYAAAADVAYAAAYAAYAADAAKNTQQEKITELFIEHFC